MPERTLFFCVALLALLLLGGCSGDGPTGPLVPEPFERTFDFESNAEGWTGDFADLPADASPDFYGLVFEHRPLPAEIGKAGAALYLAGDNHSDDLFMYVRRRLDGLTPNTPYTVHLRAEVATNAPSGCFGIGGPPGEGVYLRAGAATTEPRPVTEADGWRRLNVDKGNQAADGAQALVIDHIANGDPCEDPARYRLRTFDTREARTPSGALKPPLTARSDAAGTLWVFLGTDSGFEGLTAIYIDAVTVRLEPV